MSVLQEVLEAQGERVDLGKWEIYEFSSICLNPGRHYPNKHCLEAALSNTEEDMVWLIKPVIQKGFLLLLVRSNSEVSATSHTRKASGQEGQLEMDCVVFGIQCMLFVFAREAMFVFVCIYIHTCIPTLTFFSPFAVLV